MTTLITGGTGLMGARLAARLVARGERPVLFDIYPLMWRIDGIQDKVDVVRGSIANLHQVIDAFKKYKVDKVIHLGYMLAAESNADPLASTYVNAVGTVNIYEAGRLMGVERICVSSSISVYGYDDEYEPSQLPLVEEAPKYLSKGLLPYASSKVFMEALGNHYHKNYGVFVCGLRPSIVYGWGRLTGATAFAGELIEKPALGQPVKMAGGNALASLVYNDDVVDEWLTLHDADKSKFKRYFYNTGGDPVRVSEIAQVVKKFIPDAQIEVQCGEEKNVSGLAASVSDRAIGEDLGYKRKYTPIEVGIEEMIRDVRDRTGINKNMV